MSKTTITTVDLNAPNHSCGSCGDTVNPTIGEPSMCHRCSETWHERRRFAERMNTELAVENERHRRHIKDMWASKMLVTRKELDRMINEHACHAAGLCDRPAIDDDLLGRMLHDLNFLAGPPKRKKDE